MTRRRLVQHIVWDLREQYGRASRKEKGRILDGLELRFRKPRKSLIRLFGLALRGLPVEAVEKRKGRPAKYQDAEFIKWACELWEAMGLMNSKAMAEALPLWLAHMPDDTIEPRIKELLCEISASRLDDVTREHRKRYWKKHRSGTRSGGRGYIRFFKERVPIRHLEERPKRPGLMEADTVAHCGGSMRGQFIWTLNMTDDLTGWSEQRAVWHKRDDLVLEAVRQIIAVVPFRVWGLHTDNGMEFLNSVFVDYFSDEDNEVEYTRGRPYYKNDQAKVEQKNFTHVRKVLGYERLDYKELLLLINDLYKNEHRLLMNFFVPQSKLIHKYRDGARKYKKFDEPKTPFQRILENKHVSSTEKEKLRKVFEELNPWELQRSLKEKLKNIEIRLKELRAMDVKNKNAKASAA